MNKGYPLSLNAVNVVCFKIDWTEMDLKVLLIKRNISPHKNKWSLPGGFVNENESIEEAAHRRFGLEARASEGSQYVSEELRAPEYSTAIGLLHYALTGQEDNQEQVKSSGLMRRLADLFN